MNKYGQREGHKSSTARQYYDYLDSIDQKIQKIEKNPFLKGKMLFSKESKREYEQLVSTREYYESALKKLGFEDKNSFQKHFEKLERAETLKPIVEKKIDMLQTGFGTGLTGIGLEFLQGVIQGIEDASRKEDWERRKQAKKRRNSRQKHHEYELEMEWASFWISLAALVISMTSLILTIYNKNI